MYELSRERYRELKHFCLQYNEFQTMVKILSIPGKETENTAISLKEYKDAIELIEMTAHRTSRKLWREVLKSVTADVGYVEYGTLRRKYFWLLNKEKSLS